MKREIERLLIWGLLFMTSLIALLAGIYLIWPQNGLIGAGAQQTEDLVPLSSAPLAIQTSSATASVQVTANPTPAFAESIPRPTPADPLPRRIPPGVNLRDLSATYSDVSDRYAIAVEKLKELLDA